MITLTRGMTAIELPADLQWTDEYAWLPVGRRSSITLTGALVIEESAQASGRPITLVSQRDGTDLVAVVTRATVDALLAMASVVGAVMTLALEDERTFSVAWRHDSGPGMTAEPVKHIAPHEAGDWYLITLKFMQV